MASKFEKYGMFWPNTIEPLEIELECIRKGGRWKKSVGGMAGISLFYHWRRAQELLWPDKVWHKWRILETECFLKYKYIAEMGCAASGKSQTASLNMLLTWYCWPNCTTILVSSTDIESLENRVWGYIKQAHRDAKSQYDWLPGHLIESRRRIVYDAKGESSEGRDFKNGLQGVPCRVGENFRGLSSYIGIHNKRVFLLADELALMPRALIDSTSNLSKCQSFKILGLGNPKDTTDSLGVLAEPAAHLGGWEGGIDQRPGTKTWETKYPKGIAIQLPASDTPNNETEPGKPWKYPFLVTPKQVQEDIEIWGRDSLHITMMSEARMPRGQSAHRIITRRDCLKFHAMEEPLWRDLNRVRIAGLDAAYRGVGGDRCVFCEVQFGEQAYFVPTGLVPEQFVNQAQDINRSKTILALIDMQIVPINVSEGNDISEDQVAKWCKEECEKRAIPPENFFFDSTGRGSLASAFARVWSGQVVGVEFGDKASDRKVSNEIDVFCKDYYFNLRTEMWYSVRLAAEAEQLRGLNEDLVRELGMCEWMHKIGTNKIMLEPKEQTKLKVGRSPDLGDSFIVALEGARRRGFVIARLSNKTANRDLENWKRKIMEQSRSTWNSFQLEQVA